MQKIKYIIVILEELIDLELNVSDTLITLLLCGVGIYSLEHKGLSMEYNHLVLNLASQGKLAYLISDNSICYGTNYPINRVIITDDYVEKHSVNTLYQLMGRAGRVGKSWTAEIYISNLTGLKIIDINQINIEAININEKFIELYNKKQLTINRTINNILAQYGEKEIEQETKQDITFKNNKIKPVEKKIQWKRKK